MRIDVRDHVVPNFRVAMKALTATGLQAIPRSDEPMSDIFPPIIPVSFSGTLINLVVPNAYPIRGEDKGPLPKLGLVVETGARRRGILSTWNQTRRIARLSLRHSMVPYINRNTMPRQAEEMMDRGFFYLAGFWNQYYEALLTAWDTVTRDSISHNQLRIQSGLNRAVTKLLNALEVVSSDAHLDVQCRSINIMYPGDDAGQGVIRSNIPQDVLFLVRKRFHEAALDLGYDIISTSKSHPGRRALYAPSGYTVPATQLSVFANFGCPQRANREMFSGATNAQRFKNMRHSEPLVVGTLGPASFLEETLEYDVRDVGLARGDGEAEEAEAIEVTDGVSIAALATHEKSSAEYTRVKYLNCAFFTFREVTPIVDGEPIEVDQVIGSGWIRSEGTLDTIEERTVSEEYVDKEETEEVRGDDGNVRTVKTGRLVAETHHDVEERHEGLVRASLSRRAQGGLFSASWQVTSLRAETSSMTFKVVNPDGMKGMVIPEPIYWLAKRENEDFYRPIFLVFSCESLKNKEAQRSVLRMMLSRLPDVKDTRFDHKTPRSEFPSIMKDTLDKLRGVGDSGYSRFFRLTPDPTSKKEINVLGFITVNGKVYPCMETDGIGVLHGNLEELGKVVEGEMPILRMPEDEAYGQQTRIEARGNAIRWDPFLVVGNEGISVPRDEAAAQLLNNAARLYHSLAEMPLSVPKQSSTDYSQDYDYQE